MRSPAATLMLAVACALGGAALATAALKLDDGTRQPPRGGQGSDPPRSSAAHSRERIDAKGDAARTDRKVRPTPKPRVQYRNSIAIGIPEAGSLQRGVQFPAEGKHFFTWDPIQRQQPSRSWRRWGTDELVRTVLGAIRDHRRAYPAGPRIGVGDLSRPEGGDFGPQYGGIGHASHQNGLDADVYYPRLDRAERPPRAPSQVDQRLAQDLVDRFVAAGAVRVFVGPNLSLTGPPEVVVPLVNHDNHLHVRLPGA